VVRNMFMLLLGGFVLASAPPEEEGLVRVDEVELKKVEFKDGRLRAGEERSVWRFRLTPRGTLIYVSGGGWSGWYLNYDHKGKDRRVGLVPEPGPGCYWRWTEGARQGHKQGPSGPGGPYYTIPCRATPVNGPLKGWSLAADGTDVVLAESPKKELDFTASINGPYSE
jgi:hypothetical protein